MKAMLVSPYRTFEKGKAYRTSKRGSKLRYPIGLYSIAAVLEANGFQAPVLDLAIEDLSLEEAVRREKPDVLGITAVTENRFQAMKVAKRARKVSPDLIIVAGGPHFSFTAEDTLKNVPEIDFVVRGEGEATMLELMQFLEAGASTKTIAGISFAANGKITHNAERIPLQDLDALPAINWDSIPCEKYNFRFMGMPCVSLLTSRGCPINCTFCSVTKMWGKHLRWRSPSSVVDEIEYLLDAHGFEAVFFNDDTFTLNRRHLLGICEEIERRQLRFHWICQARVDTVNRTVLETMKKAGCCYIYFGVESGSQKMLDSIHKRITREQVIQFVKECKAAGIISHALFMYSLPAESDQDRRLTFEFIEELISLGVDSFTAGATIIFPGTEIEATAREQGVLPADFSWSAPYDSAENKAIKPWMAHTPLYTESLTFNEMRLLEERIEAMQRPLQTALHLREHGAFRNLPRYLWTFTQARSVNDLRVQAARGQELAIALAKLIKNKAAIQG